MGLPGCLHLRRLHRRVCSRRCGLHQRPLSLKPQLGLLICRAILRKNTEMIPSVVRSIRNDVITSVGFARMRKIYFNAYAQFMVSMGYESKGFCLVTTVKKTLTREITEKRCKHANKFVRI